MVPETLGVNWKNTEELLPKPQRCGPSAWASEVSCVMTFGRLEMVVALWSRSFDGAASADGAPLNAMSVTLVIRNAIRAPRIHPPRSIRGEPGGLDIIGGARSVDRTRRRASWATA